MRWEGAKFDNVREVVRLAELHLQAQLQVAIAADQRAMAFTTTIAAVLTAISGGTIAVLLASQTNWTVAIAGITASGCLLAALYYGIKVTRPVKFHFPGSWPEVWTELDLRRDLRISLMEHARNCQDDIKENEEILSQNGAYLRTAQRLTFAAPVVASGAAAVTWMVTAAEGAALSVAVAAVLVGLVVALAYLAGWRLVL